MHRSEVPLSFLGVFEGAFHTTPSRWAHFPYHLMYSLFATLQQCVTYAAHSATKMRKIEQNFISHCATQHPIINHQMLCCMQIVKWSRSTRLPHFLQICLKIHDHCFLHLDVIQPIIKNCIQASYEMGCAAAHTLCNVVGSSGSTMGSLHTAPGCVQRRGTWSRSGQPRLRLLMKIPHVQREISNCCSMYQKIATNSKLGNLSGSKSMWFETYNEKMRNYMAIKIAS